MGAGQGAMVNTPSAGGGRGRGEGEGGQTGGAGAVHVQVMQSCKLGKERGVNDTSYNWEGEDRGEWAGAGVAKGQRMWVVMQACKPG